VEEQRRRRKPRQLAGLAREPVPEFELAMSQLSRPLDECPVKDGFRQRGFEMTRIETFTDAAFAFAVTLMVVSVDIIPRSYDEMIAAMKGVPAFGISFAMIMLFWHGHWKWSRRFGLEDFPTILLSCLLVFTVLIYVYPLKFLFTGMMSFFSGGKLATAATTRITPDQLYTIFAIYGVGFVVLCGTIVLLNLHAWRHREKLRLSEIERLTTRSEITSWLIVCGTGVASIILALTTKPAIFALPGWIYMILPVVMPIHGMRYGRRLAALQKVHHESSS
jgi:uncharacterized membrane protein